MEFTGEYFVPGKSGKRIEDDHIERYIFACDFAQEKSVLDIACGAGYSAPLFIKTGALSYTGVDLNKKLIEHAMSTYGSDSIHYFEGNACTYTSEQQFDLITCFETIEHIPDYNAVLHTLFSLLAPEGTLLISSPNRPITSPLASSLSDKPANQFHTQEFTPAELLARIKEHGFSVKNSTFFGQRQRMISSNGFFKRLTTRLFGNPDSSTSAKVTPVKFKTPRYFIIVATKS